MVNWLNEKLTGFRTFLLALLPVALLLVENSAQVLGPMLVGGQVVNKYMIVGSLLVALPVALKQIKTDVLPKIQGRVIVK